MPEAEHLDLITSVQDDFTSELTRLSGLLETAGQLADQVSPIRIRTEVYDSDLDELMGKMGTLEGMDVGESLSGSGSGFDTTATEIFEESTEELVDSMDSLDDTVNNLQPLQRTPDGVGVKDPFEDVVKDLSRGESSGATTAGTATAAAARGSGQTATADGSGVVGLDTDEIKTLQRRFGIDATDETLMSPDLSPAHFTDDAVQPIFEVTPGELGRNVTPRAMRRSLDIDSLVNNLDLDGPEDLIGRTFSDLMADMPDDIDFFDDMFDTRQLRMEQFKESLFDMRIGMTKFYDILAAFMPLMFTFVGAFPAAIGALGGLAAATGGAATALLAIGGLGLLGAASQEAGGGMPGFSDITDVLSDIPDEFFDAFGNVAERLAPEFEAALDGLSVLFDELAWRIDNVLTDTGIREMGRAFGRWLIPFISNSIDSLMRLGDAARPVFSMIASGFGDIDLLGGLAGTLGEALPQLSQLSSMLVQAIPAIVQFSMGMLQISTRVLQTITTIGGMISWVADLVIFFEDGNKAIGTFVGSLLTLASGLFLASNMGSFFRDSMIGSRIATIATTSWTSTLSGVLQKGLTPSLMGATSATWTFNAALSTTMNIIRGILAMTGIGLVFAGISVAVTKLSDHFMDLGGNVSDATDSLQEFERQRSSMGGSGSGVYTGSLGREVYVDVTDSTEINIDGGSRDVAGDAEYASFIDNSSMDQYFS